MSANRSVQAAQRRRSGPNSEAVPGRTPQPSINSAQIFANQGRPGSDIPQGRLQQEQKSGSKAQMTIPQAITLITLRLGAVETKLIKLENNESQGIQIAGQDIIEGQDNMVLIDSNVIQSITARLESLEKRSSSSTSTLEVGLLKQQVDTFKQAIVQTKTSTTSTTSLVKDLKSQVDSLKNELAETKELLSALQNLTMDNSQKIMDLSINIDEPFNDPNFHNSILNNSVNYETEFTDLQNDNEDNEIVGTDLKHLIESEINANI